MIIVEQVGNRERRYSDRNMMLLQNETGELYEDAVDVVPCAYTYTETDEPITDETEVTDAEALDILLGGAT